ncbi:MAG: LuxR C-terminal-related transcriptional regulator [Cyanobacteriota bacterium]|nr:LuxR C-terminal-related transcriptional regulator [Cyanobacteriota bacterium]
MSEQEEFEAKFEQLTATEVRVLEQLVLGRSDEEIAANRRIRESTVRKYIQHICDTLDVDKKRGRYRRNSLVTLIAKYKPELINGETPPSSKIEPKPQQTSTFDPDFVGRGDAMRDLDYLFNRGTKCILILSPGGRGKTTLAWRYLQSRFSPDEILYFPIAKETKDIASVESLVEERLRKLGEEPGREFMVSLERLREKLAEKPMGVLIDNLEPALDESNRFISQHRSYLNLFAQVLLSPQVQAVTIVTSRAPLHEGLDIMPYPLEPLDVAAWQAYFEHESIVTDAPVLEEMHETYNGNALAMRVLRYPIGNDYAGDLIAYWADFKSEDGVVIEDPVLNLMQEQFKTLERLHPNAYKLLCRMSCYRYQDIPTVPKEGLFRLLWDVSKPETKRVLKALKDRALVNFVKGEYRLHPVIRAEALKRLRESEDWEEANRVAAEFWTESITIVSTPEDGLKKFEPFYHYIEIQEWQNASEIFFEKVGDTELIAKLRSFGFISKCLDSINLLKDNSSINEYTRASFWVYLADIHVIAGYLKQAIFEYQKAIPLLEKNKEKLFILSKSGFVINPAKDCFDGAWSSKEAPKSVFKIN